MACICGRLVPTTSMFSMNLQFEYLYELNRYLDSYPVCRLKTDIKSFCITAILFPSGETSIWMGYSIIWMLRKLFSIILDSKTSTFNCLENIIYRVKCRPLRVRTRPEWSSVCGFKVISSSRVMIVSRTAALTWIISLVIYTSNTVCSENGSSIITAVYRPTAMKFSNAIICRTV